MDRDRKQIRLLKITDITPCQIVDQIVGQLELFDLGTSNTPLYRALSYTWGVPNPTYSIIVNEQEFTIQSNLFGFLQIYGPRHLDEYIWIDQICINQNDIAERNHQVQQMTLIYQRAKEVLIWLGPDQNPTQVPQHREGCCFNKACKDWLVELDNCLWVEDLVHNDYWSRMWIIQEVLLAKSLTIYCGPTRLRWDQVKKFMVNNGSQSRAPITFWFLDWLVQRRRRESGEGRYQYSHFELDFKVAIKYCSKSACKDPKDKVYALQGLLKWDQRLEIDYNKETARVFSEAAAIVLWSSYEKNPDRFYGRDPYWDQRQDMFSPDVEWTPVGWNPLTEMVDVLDPIWHLACEMGFRTTAEKGGVGLGLDHSKLKLLVMAAAGHQGPICEGETFEALVKDIEDQFRE